MEADCSGAGRPAQHRRRSYLLCRRQLTQLRAQPELSRSLARSLPRAHTNLTRMEAIIWVCREPKFLDNIELTRRSRDKKDHAYLAHSSRSSCSLGAAVHEVCGTARRITDVARRGHACGGVRGAAGTDAARRAAPRRAEPHRCRRGGCGSDTNTHTDTQTDRHTDRQTLAELSVRTAATDQQQRSRS